jgi:RimJ/RimL family protein N-acetyltransferase
MNEARPDVSIRPWQPGDEQALCEIADNRRIWRNLANAFPHPYERAHADYWVEVANANPDAACHFAVLLGDEITGGVGFERLRDLRCRTAEIGYWIGEPFWGRGIATTALLAATAYAFDHYDFTRAQASVLDWNPASCRVLEKAGYTLEGRLRASAFKDGEVCDQLIYARLRGSNIRS